MSGALMLAGLTVVAQVAFAPDAGEGQGLIKVPIFGAPSRASFEDSEQVLAPYLMIAAPMANDVVSDPSSEVFGFMSGGWWRPADTQAPTNARIMEHVATLAWFYSNQREWNPLYRSEVLLPRLEAAISYYTSLQLEDGSYPEYKGQQSLAATSFGIVAQADTYEALLKVGAGTDSTQQLRSSLERAVSWFMNRDAAHWSPPIPVFNQVAAGLVGAQRALQVLEDPPVDQTSISERVTYLCEKGQASAGFMHEPLGVDFGYNFTVTMPDLAWLYAQTRHPDLVPLVEKYMNFMRLAVLPEPDTGDLWHVPALHARNVVSRVTRPPGDLSDRAALAKSFLSAVPSIALFLPTKEEKLSVRQEFRTSSEPVRPLVKPDTSPRTWMYGPLAPEGPTQAARSAVEHQLPMLTSERFSKLERGSAGEQYLFVRRPSYYVAGVFGAWIKSYNSTRQLGTLWSPTLGTILVGTNNPKAPEGWETVGPSGEFSTRQSSTTSEYFDSRISTRTSEIEGDLVRQKTTLFAQRKESTAGSADYTTGWSYWDQGLRFSFLTQREGECTQRLPILLKEGDKLTLSDGTTFGAGGDSREVLTSSLVLSRDSGRVLFDLGSSNLRTFITPSGKEMSGGEIHRVGVIFETQIVVNVVFLDDGQSELLQAEAHRHRNGEISLRLVIYPPGEKYVSQLRITGTGLRTVVDIVPSGFQVLEYTLTPSQTGATSLMVSAHEVDGSVAGETTVTIR